MTDTINISGWLDRRAALATLGVRPQTLYAYVSRGRIAVRPDPHDVRRSLYRAADVDALASRRARGRRAAAIAARTLAGGEPSSATALSTVAGGRLVSAGHDALALAERGTLEEVAALLWGASGAVALPAVPAVAASGRAAAFTALATLAGSARDALSVDPTGRRDDAAHALAILGAALGAHGDAAPMHARLARGWGAGPAAADAIRRALVLLADHELNASAFAARVAASTGAPIAACLLAALATLGGPRHGGAADAVAAVLADAARIGVEEAVARHERGAVPGFGHPLYPEGDPRAGALLATLDVDADLARLRDAVAAHTGDEPNVDFALLALARAHGLPADAPFRLFAVGRSVGWAAHAMEQLADGTLIRPRARYVGAGVGA